MNDNVIIENIEFTEEIYQKAIIQDKFDEDENHGIGD